MTAPSVDENVQSRFKVLERPTLSPGKCAVCGAVDRSVVDFGLNIQYYGAVMLCVTCLTEAAGRIGMYTPEAFNAESLQTGQSLQMYLESRNLKVISDELHHAIFDFVARCAVEPASIVNGLSDYVDRSAPQVVSEQFEFDLGQSDSNAESPSKQPNKRNK